MKKETRFKDDFFIAIPGDFYNYLEAGRVTPTMWCVYTMILRQVDFETGIWLGSALKVQAAWGGQIPLRTIQDNLERLCDAGLLKSFYRKNSRGNYPVVIHGYRIRFGEWKGYRLNADATTDPYNPVYERHDIAASPQTPRKDYATTAREPRNDRARGASPNACTPDTPDFPEAPETPETSEAPHIHTLQPARPSDQENGEGWLEGRLVSLYTKKTAVIDEAKFCTLTDSEKENLNLLIKLEGELWVLLGFYYFLGRSKGLADLTHPYSMFFNESRSCIRVARSEAKDNGERYESRRISAVASEYSVGPDDYAALCLMGNLHEELGGDGTEAVRHYLNAHFDRRSVSTEPELAVAAG